MFGPADLAARFAPLERARGVLLAVSGGPDSVALMLMAADWAKTGAAPPLFVATVDHGLRPESRQEAEQVGLWAGALSLPHRILFWEGAKPKTAIQERAREARYALLCAYAAEIGADYLVTAHHADDQAETILFRLLRGSGISGLAGMPVAARRGDLIHLRPLLDCPKDALIAFCEARGQPFFRDPSNENPAFARARLRRLEPILAQEGLDRDALLRLGRRAARADLALDVYTEKLRAACHATRADGQFSAPFRALGAEPAEILGRLIEAEIHALGQALGIDKPLRLDRLETLTASLQAAMQKREPWRGSLAGMALVLDREGSLTICRERPRRRGRPSIRPMENSPLREVSPSACRDPVTSE
ncbi:MAG: tRNA lysidine(34) synthetase TilS [Methylovirgula sp.]